MARDAQGAPGRGPGSAEVALLAVALLALAGLRLAAFGGPELRDDSYQYLSVAENLRAHGTAATSIVHFDAERAHGTVPAPATTFPSGYPALIALVAAPGLPLPWAGLLLSLAAAVAVLPLLRAAGTALALPASAIRVALVGWALGSQPAVFATTVLTEAPFTAVILAALVLLLPRQGVAPGPVRVALAGALVGLAYHLRYAGLFFAAALHVRAIGDLRRGRARRGWLVGLALCDAAIAAGMARNLFLTGTWQGGNTGAAGRTASVVFRHLAFAAGDLLLGSSGWLRPPWTAAPALCAAFTVAALAGLAALSAWARRSHGAVRPDGASRGGRALTAGWLGAYLLGVIAAGFATAISLGARILVPALPLALLLGGAAVTAWRGAVGPRGRALGAGLLAVLAVAYAGVNVATVRHADHASPHVAVARALDAPGADGAPLSRWIAATVPADAVLVSTLGQPTGWLVRRPTVSTVGETFSSVAWTEDGTREVMTRFGASYLVVYPEALATRPGPGARAAASPGLDSPFFRGLVEGDVPGWLELAARNPRVLIFRRRG